MNLHYRRPRTLPGVEIANFKSPYYGQTELEGIGQSLLGTSYAW